MGDERPDSGPSAAAAAGQTPTPTSDLAPPGGRTTRRASSAFIALLLAYQIAMPLRYYLSGRGTDERFSWRMFSTLRMQQCEVRVDDLTELADGTTSPQPVDLQAIVHTAWINLLERNRRAVVDKLLARRCEQPDLHAARYTRSCKDTDGRELPALHIERSCTAPDQSPRGAAPDAPR